MKQSKNLKVNTLNALTNEITLSIQGLNIHILDIQSMRTFKAQPPIRQAANLLTYFAIALSVLSNSETALAQSSGGGERPWLLSKGAAAREAKRFNLYDWMEQKNRNQVMDMWLSLNTPSPYEFMLGGTLAQYELSIDNVSQGKNKSYEGELSAYARFVGLTGEYQNNTEERFNDVSGIFNLRLFGQTIQGTHLTFHYGLRTRTESSDLYRLNQQFAAATLQVYLTKQFGLNGQYRHFYPVTESHFGETTGSMSSYGLFIDFASLRIFGSYYTEFQNSKQNNITNEYKREGSKVGLQLYF